MFHHNEEVVACAGQQSSPHKEPVDVLNPVHTLNPVHMVGNLLKAGASAAQEMPNQALGRAMGAASRRHVTTPKSSEDHSHDQTTAVEDDPGYGRNQAAAVKGSAPASNHSTSNHDRHGAASDHASASPQGVATAAAATSHPANNPHDDDDDDADAKPSGWDKARHAVAEGKVKQLSSKSRGSAAKESRQLNKPSTSGGSLSKVETGPMQWMYRRGGKFAATVAKAAAAKRGVAGSSTHQRQDQQDQAGDIETGDAGLLNGSATECNRVVGSDDKPGFDAVSRHGAKDPEAAAGGQVGFVLFLWLAVATLTLLQNVLLRSIRPLLVIRSKLCCFCGLQ